MLDKKQIRAIFLFKFKMGHKAVETAHNINSLAQKQLTNIPCSGGLRSFAKEIRALKMRSLLASCQELTMTNWEKSLKLILLQLHMKLPKDSTLTMLQSFGIWSKSERWKSSISRCLMSWPQVKKIALLKCCLFLFCAKTMNHFSIGYWHATKSGFYMTTGGNQLSSWIEKKLQSTFQNQTCTHKASWPLLVVLLPVWSTTAFRTPVKPLHLRSMLSKLISYIANCNTCSWCWSIDRAQFFMTTPNHGSYNQCFKSWMNWITRFASSAIFIWPLTNQLPLP